MDYNAFSHGQLQSKIWLCDSLEPYIPDRAIVAILGSWYNVLGFMMLTRNRNKYQSILGIDIDSSAIDIATQINAGWMIGDRPKMNNIVADACSYNYQGFTTVINCSPEHMPNDRWFDNINSGTLVCIQTSNIDKNDDVWKVTNPITTMEQLVKKYPLSHYIMQDTQDITYSDWGYKRFMLIGVK
jgi:SAM-dependent methyltransferase